MLSTALALDRRVNREVSWQLVLLGLGMGRHRLSTTVTAMATLTLVTFDWLVGFNWLMGVKWLMGTFLLASWVSACLATTMSSLFVSPWVLSSIHAVLICLILTAVLAIRLT